ncbi:hypothetical protein GobsT_17800 [Gemmata obscuriglobus]|nr:hypothetical protein GobsT_17800 [Gemmata obscuriglobus]VTS03374.1 unnamed protein product [Gemmata obscuriglobus UQM 2246]
MATVKAIVKRVGKADRSCQLKEVNNDGHMRAIQSYDADF